MEAKTVRSAGKVMAWDVKGILLMDYIFPLIKQFWGILRKPPRPTQGCVYMTGWIYR
jgi:hypothetical protein